MPIHHRTCHLCEAMCGVVIEHDGEAILSIRGDKDDPFSRGHICPKAMGLKDVHEDPDRLRTPQRRSGDRWLSIGWDEAFDEVAERIDAIQRKYGKNAVALYQGNPTVHNYGGLLFAKIFQSALGTRNRYSATSADQLPQMLAALKMFGHQLLIPIPDIDRTHLFVILGANPLASNGSLMTVPDVKKRLEAIQARGGKIVVIDPRRSETAAMADQHVALRPQTDALLVAALLHEIFAQGLDRPGRLAAFTEGLDDLKRAVLPFSPEAVATITGVPASITRVLASDIAAAPSAAIYGRVGVCTQRFGGLASWLIFAMSIVTGNLDRPGGIMFTRPAFDLAGLTAKSGQKGHFAKGHSRVRGLPEFGGEYPVATLADEIETAGEGQIRALITSAGNPVLSAPNGTRIERALEKLDFMVSIDIYRNETTRHASLILPPTFALEHDHYDVIFHTLAIRNTAKYSLPLFQKPAEARHDWEILLELGTRLLSRRGRLTAAFASVQRAVLGRIGPHGLVDLALRLGPHKLSLSTLKAKPHGIDLGPLMPCLPERLFTSPQRIQAAPGVFLEDLPRLLSFLREFSKDPGALELIGRRELRSNNSWMHNSERLTKGPERCTLIMHPDDVSQRGFKSGEKVIITSRVGRVEAALEVSDEVKPGVVCLPHGWGHHRPGMALRIASSRPGVSINDLTDDLELDDLCGTAAFSGVRVWVTASGTG